MVDGDSTASSATVVGSLGDRIASRRDGRMGSMVGGVMDGRMRGWLEVEKRGTTKG